MEVIVYVIGIILVLLSIELLILIIEVVKLSSSIQSFIYTKGSEPQRDTIDSNTLVSLMSKLHLAPRYTENQQDKEISSTTSAAGEQESDKNVQRPEDESPSIISQDSEPEDLNLLSDEQDINKQQEPEPQAGPSAARRPVGAPPAASQKPKETETKAANFSIHKCPECGRENSAFRKVCFYCNSALTD